MIILDTDHITVLKYISSDRRIRLVERLQAVPVLNIIGVPIVTIEEQMLGWLASIAKERSVLRQVTPYRELSELFPFFSAFEIVPFDQQTAERFEELRSSKIRIGTMDLKIAATALVNDAKLLTANLRDFQKVPGLRVENWLS